MSEVNPYETPASSWHDHDVERSDVSYPPDQCPNCAARVTLWMSLWQATPFRFKCTNCRSIYRVSTPHMKLIFVGMMCAMVPIMIVIGACALMLGFAVLIPGGLLYIAAVALLEVWTHRHIMRNGRFVPYNTFQAF